MIDVTHQINAVRRRVGATVLEPGEARVVSLSQDYDAPVDDVWDACTDPERVARWFLPVSGDLRVGGRYQLEGNAGGTIERCDPPNGFAATWEFAGATSWIELRLTPTPDGGTRFELEHTARVGDHWEQFGPGAVGIGWDMGLAGLALHLPSGADVTAEGAAFMASEDGRRFVTLAGERWYEADAASGTDPAIARARADRTIAFYTASPA